MLGYSKEENEKMKSRLAQFGVDCDVMSAEDVRKKWSVLDTTPFPEYNEEGEIVEKVGVVYTTVKDMV